MKVIYKNSLFTMGVLASMSLSAFGVGGTMVDVDIGLLTAKSSVVLYTNQDKLSGLAEKKYADDFLQLVEKNPDARSLYDWVSPVGGSGAALAVFPFLVADITGTKIQGDSASVTSGSVGGGLFFSAAAGILYYRANSISRKELENKLSSSEIDNLIRSYAKKFGAIFSLTEAQKNAFKDQLARRIIELKKGERTSIDILETLAETRISTGYVLSREQINFVTAVRKELVKQRSEEDKDKNVTTENFYQALSSHSRMGLLNINLAQLELLLPVLEKTKNDSKATDSDKARYLEVSEMIGQIKKLQEEAKYQEELARMKEGNGKGDMGAQKGAKVE